MMTLSTMTASVRSLAIAPIVVLVMAGCEQSQQGQTEATKTAAGEEYKIAVPLGLPPVPVPEDNPMTVAKVELGRKLYFDTRLSSDGTISCATCHDPNMAWAEHKPTSEGIHKQAGTRNSPTVLNTAYFDELFWDGRAASLEEQALGPIENPIEMGHTMEVLTGELEKDEEYQKLFQEVFGTGVNNDGIAKAIAAFERTILSGNSPYDKYEHNNDESALTDEQKRGMEVFMNKGMCQTCHTPPTFSSGSYYNAGIGMDKDEIDEGRKDHTGKESDLGKFRVPHLREVANTAPYFHDGSAEKLEDAVAIMAGGGIDNPHLSPMMKAVGNANLTDQDQKDLVAFMHALSGEFPKIEAP